MLLCETGRYLFEHTVRNAEKAACLERVLLATDSVEILRAAEEVGVEAVLTSDAHRSGTDRIREAFDGLENRDDYDVVCNIQGDEPELSAASIETLVGCFRDPSVEMATLASPLSEASEGADEELMVHTHSDEQWATISLINAGSRHEIHPAQKLAESILQRDLIALGGRVSLRDAGERRCVVLSLPRGDGGLSQSQRAARLELASVGGAA